MTPNSIGFYSGTYMYVTNSCSMVNVECIVSMKTEGQTNKQTYKQTNQRRQSPYSRRATIIKHDSIFALYLLMLQEHNC